VGSTHILQKPGQTGLKNAFPCKQRYCASLKGKFSALFVESLIPSSSSATSWAQWLSKLVHWFRLVTS